MSKLSNAVASLKDRAARAVNQFLGSKLAAKIERTFAVAFVAQWAVVGNSLTQQAVVSALAAGGTAVVNGVLIPAWEKYRDGE